MTRREERATTGDPTPRWQYRFRNFSRAYSLLRETLALKIAQALRVVLGRLKVIRSAFAAGLIDDGEAWIDMLTDRNAMSHQYDFDIFEAVADKVHRRYLHLFGELWERLAAEEIAR